MTSYLRGCTSRDDVVSNIQTPSRSVPRTRKYSLTSNSSIPATRSSLCEIIAVAIDASKVITKKALEWTVKNVTQPGDQVILLALLPPATFTWKLWGSSPNANDCSIGLNLQEVTAGVQDSCRNIIRQIQNLCDVKKVTLNTKVVASATRGATAAEGKLLHVTWIVLDRHLKKEAGSCMEQLNCNLVLLSSLNCKILRLNLEQYPDYLNLHASESHSKLCTREVCRPELAKFWQPTGAFLTEGNSNVQNALRGFSTTQTSVLGGSGLGTPFTMTDDGTSLPSSSEPGSSPGSCSTLGAAASTCCLGKFVASELKQAVAVLKPSAEGAISESGSDNCSLVYTPPDGSSDKRLGNGFSENAISRFERLRQPQLKRTTTPGLSCSVRAERPEHRLENFKGFLKPPNTPITHDVSGVQEIFRRKSISRSFERKKLSQFLGPSRDIMKLLDETADETKSKTGQRSPKTLFKQTYVDSLSLRTLKSDLLKQKVLDGSLINKRAMLPLKNTSPSPRPLCSVCQHRAPVFGVPPRVFSYKELELATSGFSEVNFLAEGGFGCVHKGLLRNGQTVAIKKYKTASSQGDSEFFSEVEILSCAQHRNIVMLIGYCVEDKRRLLVYEFVCNGSLNSHIYGQNQRPLEWQSRQRIAIAVARGLRYLHEECRVGCIVHRDLRPCNILLTHDFEPMIGDFGLATWKPEKGMSSKQVIGTFGYLAPEYAKNGLITEKADVYSFGVVLLELVTGRRAVHIFGPKGQQFLTEWARPLLEEEMWHEMVDPQLEGRYDTYEATCMLQAASLCIQRNPECRPRLSQVLHILEGDTRGLIR